MKKLTKSMETKVEKIMKDESTSKSSKMKTLYDMEFDVKDITKLFEQNEMKVRYNFVYNVISNYCNMNGVEIRTTKKVGKKDQIIELFKQGKSNKEISIELKTNSNYIYKVLKEFKNKNEEQLVEATN